MTSAMSRGSPVTLFKLLTGKTQPLPLFKNLAVLNSKQTMLCFLTLQLSSASEAEPGALS
jgi:hypothetical protein